MVDPKAFSFFSAAAKLVIKILEFHNFMIIIFSNDKKKSIEVVDGGANQANSPTSSNEIELGTIPILRQQRDWVGGVRKIAIFADFQYYLCRRRVG